MHMQRQKDTHAHIQDVKLGTWKMPPVGECVAAYMTPVEWVFRTNVHTHACLCARDSGLFSRKEADQLVFERWQRLPALIGPDFRGGVQL